MFLKKYVRKAGKKALPLLLFAFFVLAALFLEGAADRGGAWTSWKTCPLSDLPQKDLFIKGTLLRVEVAETPVARRCGLSLRDLLSENRGMLFVFEESGFHGIWMKDMNFSIDIVWIDEAHRVVDEVFGASPESYPGVFKPKKGASYVLEVPQGFAKKYNIVAGDEIVF